jgi:uncharacterized protein (DUF1684 family)
MAERADARQALEVADWRRRVAELYASVRRAQNPVDAWDLWRAERERLFLSHPQSPLPLDARNAHHAPRYFPYDAAMRVVAGVLPDASSAELPSSNGAEFTVARLGTLRFSMLGTERTLALHWLTDYAGGLLISFRDSTCGAGTYGAGRYAIDTAKGADLGVVDEELVLDFNFAYQPSCSYDPRWSCPLPPRENWLDFPIPAGERLRTSSDS